MEQRVLDGLRTLAASEHGLFTNSQAAAVGASSRALRYAIGRGWLRPVRRGVYAFSGRQPSRWEPVLAAWLAAGPSAVISHAPAAAMHGFWGVADPHPELTLPGWGGRSLTGVRIHRSVRLFPDDIVQRSGVPLTSPVRTLLDLAPTTTEHLLSRILDEGAIARLWTAERIVQRLETAGGEPRLNTPRLRRLLAQRLDEASPDSVLEQRVIRAIKPWVPPFLVHHRLDLCGRIVEVDIAWPEYRLAAEIDGRDVRVASLTKFESDRRRSNLLEMARWRVIHLTAGMDDLTLLGQLIPFFPPELIDGRLREDIARQCPVPRRL